MRRSWGIVRQAWPASTDFQLAWSLRDLLALKHGQAAVHGSSQDGGMLLWQNAASKAMFGERGVLEVLSWMLSIPEVVSGWD